MKNAAPTESSKLTEMCRVLFSNNDLNIEIATANLQQMRNIFTEQGTHLDRLLVEQIFVHRRGLQEAQHHIAQCQEMLEEVTTPPLHPAIYQGKLSGDNPEKAIVQIGNLRRAVIATKEVGLDKLARGDEVYLNHEQNLIIRASPEGPPRCGETAAFEQRLLDGRLLIRWHDEPLVVDVSAGLEKIQLRPGDMVRFDRNAWMAFEKIALAPSHRFFIEDAPSVPLSAVGGQTANLQNLLSALTVILVEPARAAAYALTGRNSILLCGPPGCGKTLMARVAASEIQRFAGVKCCFAVVKPAELESPFVGQSEQNIRQFFQSLREASESGFAVAFFDEIEAVGRIRGGSISHHSDKFLAAMLAELDGFMERKNVAIICATNRKDLLDSALYERLSNMEIQVGRPDLRAARAIFRIHLSENVPYFPNGELAESTREELIEMALSKFYAPNAENRLCHLRFRDGKQRTIVARELVSGRQFENVCRTARQTAFLREVRGGVPGVRAEDMENAVDETLDRLRSILTIHNAHAYLSDLPQDLDVVSIEPVQRKIKQPQQYFRSAN